MLPTYPVLRIVAVALTVGVMTTCVEQRIPTSPVDPGTTGIEATATLASTAITHALLTSGNKTVNQ
jgi:hypothetical protein